MVLFAQDAKDRRDARLMNSARINVRDSSNRYLVKLRKACLQVSFVLEESQFDDVQRTKHKIDHTQYGVAVTCVLWARLPDFAIIRRQYAELREYHRYHEIGRTSVFRLFANVSVDPAGADSRSRNLKTSSISETKGADRFCALVRKGLAPFVF